MISSRNRIRFIMQMVGFVALVAGSGEVLAEAPLVLPGKDKCLSQEAQVKTCRAQEKAKVEQFGKRESWRTLCVPPCEANAKKCITDAIKQGKRDAMKLCTQTEEDCKKKCEAEGLDGVALIEERAKLRDSHMCWAEEKAHRECESELWTATQTATQAACRPTDACRWEGRCSYDAGLESKDNATDWGRDASGYVGPSQYCRNTIRDGTTTADANAYCKSACEQRGLCEGIVQGCKADSDLHCQQSIDCKEKGACTYDAFAGVCNAPIVQLVPADWRICGLTSANTVRCWGGGRQE